MALLILSDAKRAACNVHMAVFMPSSGLCAPPWQGTERIVVGERGAPRGLFHTSWAEGPQPDGYFPGSAKLWKQVGASKRPGTLLHCEAERLDSLSQLDLGL